MPNFLLVTLMFVPKKAREILGELFAEIRCRLHLDSGGHKCGMPNFSDVN